MNVSSDATGASLAPVTLMSRVATLLRFAEVPPSSTWKATVRVLVDGSPETFAYRTSRSAVSHVASELVPPPTARRDRVPVAVSNGVVFSMSAVSVNESRSSELEWLPVIWMVAAARPEPSGSLTTSVLVIDVAGSFSV